MTTAPSPTVFLVATGAVLPLPSVASSRTAEDAIDETRRSPPSDLPSQAQVGQPSFAAAHEGYNKRGAKLEAQEQKIAAMGALLNSVEEQVGPLVRLELELNTSKNRAGLAALGDILALLTKWKQAVPKVQAMHGTEQRFEARFNAQALQIERLTMALCCLAALSLVTIVATLFFICRRPADATPPGEPKAPTKATPPVSHRVRSVSSAAAPPQQQHSRKDGGKKNRDLQRSMSEQMSSGSSVAVQEETKEQL